MVVVRVDGDEIAERLGDFGVTTQVAGVFSNPNGAVNVAALGWLRGCAAAAAAELGGDGGDNGGGRLLDLDAAEMVSVAPTKVALLSFI